MLATERPLSGSAKSRIRPSYPRRKPITSIPATAALRTTARIAAVMPGASPPAVRIAIRRGREPVRSGVWLLPLPSMGFTFHCLSPISNLTSAPGRTNLVRRPYDWESARLAEPSPNLSREVTGEGSESGEAGGLEAEERGLGFVLGVGDGGAVAVGYLSVEVDGGDFVAERLVAARDVDLGPFIVGARQ